MLATILTWNPTKFPDLMKQWDEVTGQTSAGNPVPDRWSVGRIKNIPVGRRVFLLRQGDGPRGIVAAGVTTSARYEGEHWDKSGGRTGYVDVEWDAFVPDPDEPLATDELLVLVPQVHWNNLMQSGSSTPNDTVAARIEELWVEHLTDEGHAVTTGVGAGRGQGYEPDAEVRRKIEDYAQRLLMGRYERDGWVIEDTRHGHPYDARAVRDGETHFLEAKGTRGDGTSVLVTAGEVNWARSHSGQCFIGIVSGIAVRNGEVIEGSGELTIQPWEPDASALTPTAYRWTTNGERG